MKQIFLIMGDIHGDASLVEQLYEKAIKIYSPREYNLTFILLGDVGANYYGNIKDMIFKYKLSLLPVNFLCLRGNHEQRPSILMKQDPDKWKVISKYNGYFYVEKEYPNILYFKDDVGVYNINGRSVLTIPGAYSIDKEFRLKNGWKWFPEEQLSADEMLAAKTICKNNGMKFDLILSHTCPYNWRPTDLFLSCINQETVDNSMELFLQEVANNISFKAWCWGHFHEFRVYEGKTRIMLNGYHAVELNSVINKDPKSISIV